MADPPERLHQLGRLHREMLQAREEWDRASEDLRRVLEHPEDLSDSDGRQALRNARNAHRLAIAKYNGTLKRFADCVLGRGPDPDS